MSLEIIDQQTKKIMNELFAPSSKFRNIEVCVIACSISKIEGKKFDTIGDPSIADAICKCLWSNKPFNVQYAVQCCEHLNKALIIEKNLCEKLNLEEVLVYPVDKAGGTFASTAFSFFNEPVIVEKLAADAGLDIGLNIIGMHLKDVAQPLVLENEFIGSARVVAARTRLKLIGGERAVYKK